MKQPRHVLLIEDDEVEILAARRSFTAAGQARRLLVAEDGVQALALLRGLDGHTPPPRPLTILLDLSMPRMGGLDFLRQLRADAALRELPVLVTSASNNPRDIESAFDLAVEGYLVKPLGFDRFLQSLAAGELDGS